MEIGKRMYDFFTFTEGLREDLNVVFMFHEDDEGNIKTIGKVLDSWFNPAEAFTYFFYATKYINPDDSWTHSFIVNSARAGDRIFPDAASPVGVFEKPEIDNDLQLVIEAIHDYSYAE